jgi:DNA polymerase III delta subunit
MLILCCGPDTYRAVARARELENAFRQKHDASGSSIEHLVSGKDAADEIIERSLSVSLFTPMRFLRADDLAGSCPKAKWKPLVQALTRDPERVIVVSVEHEKPDASKMKLLNEVPKLIINDYSIQYGKPFRTWLGEAAKAVGVSDEPALDRLARACDGDAWLASNELLKLAAGGESVLERASSSDAYGLAAFFLCGDRTRFGYLYNENATQGASYPLLQQSVSAITQPAYARVSQEQAEKILAATILIHNVQRSGLASDQEALELLP